MTKGKIITRRTRARVEFRHVDMMGVVHNSQYFNWFENGRMELMEEVIPMFWAIEHRVAAPVVENHCHYLRPARMGDDLVITTRHRVTPTWEGKLTFDHTLSHARTKQELAAGQAAVTLIDLTDHRPLREIPADLWQRYLDLD